MNTKNPRINVTFEEATTKLLTNLAKKENRSLASVVRELIDEALELREDVLLSDLAKKRDKKGVKAYNHDEAWK